MLSPTCKFYMSSKFHKLFASPINKGRPPSRSQVPIAPIPSISFLMAAIASSRERTSDLGSCRVTRAGTVPSSSDLGGRSGLQDPYHLGAGQEQWMVHSRSLPHLQPASGSALYRFTAPGENGIKPCLTLVGIPVVTHSAPWTASCKTMLQQPM